VDRWAEARVVLDGRRGVHVSAGSRPPGELAGAGRERIHVMVGVAYVYAAKRDRRTRVEVARAKAEVGAASADRPDLAAVVRVERIHTARVVAEVHVPMRHRWTSFDRPRGVVGPD